MSLSFEQPAEPRNQRLAAAMWTLLALFGLRVVGQLCVEIWQPSWLPPSEEWASGAIPYPTLLASQVLIILFMAAICWQFTIGRGFFFRANRAQGRAWLSFGSVY